MQQLRTWGAQLLSSLQEAFQNLILYLPAVMLAVVLIVLGWVVARIMRNVTEKTVERLDWLFERATAQSPVDGKVLRQSAARALAAVVFWAVMLSFFAAALRSLGWPVVEAWTESLLGYLPELIGAALIILLGFIGGTLVRHILEPAAAGVGIAFSGVLGRIGQVAIVVTALIIGTAHVGIDVSFLIQLATVLVGATAAGLALALALGTRGHLSNLVGLRYARKHYRVGERVRIGSLEGRIVALVDGYLFLETDEGDVSVPGGYFSKEPFVKLSDGVGNER
ncbi:MAG: mechanosensitive ion channel [Gammaproteobacteria bacterium]|nr:mechanosensitive ion channel [Gammaproteobacteria bacterium]